MSEINIVAGDSMADASSTSDLPAGPIEYAIPHIRRKPFFSMDIEYWGVVFSGGSFYLFVKSNKETVTLAGVYADDLVDDLFDGIKGRRRKKAVKKALEGGLQGVLAIADYWYRLTPMEIADVRTRRGPFRFRIMFPEMNERKKFSLVARNKYRKGFKRNLDSMMSS